MCFGTIFLDLKLFNWCVIFQYRVFLKKSIFFSSEPNISRKIKFSISLLFEAPMLYVRSLSEYNFCKYIVKLQSSFKGLTNPKLWLSWAWIWFLWKFLYFKNIFWSLGVLRFYMLVFIAFLVHFWIENSLSLQIY